jgi:hypothetical protein
MQLQNQVAQVHLLLRLFYTLILAENYVVDAIIIVIERKYLDIQTVAQNYLSQKLRDFR